MNLYDLPEMDIIGSDEVYTPRRVFDLLGLTFDLDVCAPVGGLPWIPATRHYSLADDGLSQPWEGRVWCNPPYSNASPWIRKFIEHRNGIIIVPMVRSRAFLELWNAADATCVPSAFNVTGDPCHFIKDNKRRLIGFAVALASFGTTCSNALRNLGHARPSQQVADAMVDRIQHLEYDLACSDGWDGRTIVPDADTEGMP